MTAKNTSDERDKRLEVVLAAPMKRMRWALSSGAGVFLSVLVLVLAAAIPTTAGALLLGDDVIRPFVGVMVLGIYTAALVGVGLAVGGLVSPSLAVGGLLLGAWGFVRRDLKG